MSIESDQRDKIIELLEETDSLREEIFWLRTGGGQEHKREGALVFACMCLSLLWGAIVGAGALYLVIG